MSCDIKNPKQFLACGYRTAFGLSLALVGLSHYLTIGAFTEMVSSDLGALSGLGTLWAYVLPGLQIVGGLLLVAKQQHHIANICIVTALGSTSVGMLLKPVLGDADLTIAMPMAQNALLWLAIYALGTMVCCCGDKKNDL